MKRLWPSGDKNYRRGAETHSQGGIPIYNPTIAKVKVHYDIFMEGYEKQKSLQSLTNRSLEQLASMRVQADRLILDIWNQVEAKFRMYRPMRNAWKNVVIMV